MGGGMLSLPVLILVLMEYKWNPRHRPKTMRSICLNPCFNGLQMELLEREVRVQESIVLIFVLMEYKWNT